MKPEGGKGFSYLACKSGRLDSALNKYPEYLCNKEMDGDKRLVSTQSYVQTSWLEAVKNWDCREV